ncbi:DeoR/GlpR family DNA-binding transcription regulator [Devosia sp. YIM 151766]|uniref:DeoR/GlpR family DNA-binding transcription regulator n=1 Tax=Devosia sp. YIM 151766 TaxID=3017325 RepID=UPI00255C294B|nr:DeoR/GlpR family DNA-binding transcription regulator [Devosia sp. YIM 151766]WIY53284.1 DeoR/GlpR family DNA-binding transcription regulator [Devosia sp. YIM 151766]
MALAKSGLSKAMRVATLSAELAGGRALHIGEASKLLGVSDMTIRRDIQQNPDRLAYFGGYVMAAGIVSADGSYSLASAADAHQDAKRRACQHAVELLRPGETIFVDCGTTLVHLIDLIPDDLEITVVCYALNIADRLARKPKVTIIMLGGVYHPASATFFGQEGLRTLSGLGVNLALLSAAGLDEVRGATCAHFHEAEIKRHVMAIAAKRVLVVDQSKVGCIRSVVFAAIDAFDTILTEHGTWTRAPTAASQ